MCKLDDRLALMLMMKAGEKRDSESVMGFAYANGRGVVRDYAKSAM